MDIKMQCDCSESENCLQQLKAAPFSTRTFENKHAIIDAGRPVPSLTIVQQKKRYNRYFSNKIYEQYNWLAGCKHINKLFCWACLLFSEETTVWTNAGYADLNNLTNAAKKHDQSENHMRCALSLCNFGQNKVEVSISRQFREEIERHNSKVDRNRNLMRRLIDITCFLGKQDYTNRSNFMECIQLLANYDGILEDHLHASNENEDTNIFPALSNRIQNDLISAIAVVLKGKIRCELQQTDFLSIMIEETPDMSGKQQLCVILRYFTESNDVVDRFMGFIDVSHPIGTAEAVTKIITDILKDCKCIDKLVAQSYDGASVLSSSCKNGVEQNVREISPSAMYVWCNAHILNLLLSKSCERIVETKHFFGTIKNLGIFFLASTERSNLYDRYCSEKLPRVTQTRWDHSRTVNVIFSELSNLKKLFDDVLENEANWDVETLSTARMYSFVLEDFEFNYFLEIFNQIFVQTHVLCSIIQSKLSDIGYCIENIENVKIFLENLFMEFEKIYTECVNVYGEPKRKRNMNDVRAHYKRIFREIVDNIKSEIDDRYREIRQLIFFRLLDPDCFQTFKTKFPEETFNELVVKYGSKFDFGRLRNELNCLYTSSGFAGMNAYGIIRFCHENKMCKVFPQMIKLSRLIVTIPASSASTERSFARLKRVHTYLRDTQGQERVSCLAMILLEKDLVLELKRTSTFYDDVISAFLKKNRRMELIYKK